MLIAIAKFVILASLALLIPTIIHLCRFCRANRKSQADAKDLSSKENSELSPQGIEHMELLYRVIDNSAHIQVALIYLTAALLLLTALLATLTTPQIFG